MMGLLLTHDVTPSHWATGHWGTTAGALFTMDGMGLSRSEGSMLGWTEGTPGALASAVMDGMVRLVGWGMGMPEVTGPSPGLGDPP